MSFLLWSPAVFLGVTFFGYVAHWSLHQPWMGRLAAAHLAHHDKLYPPGDFLSDTYRSAGRDSTVFIFAGLSVPIVAMPVVAYLFGWMSLITAALIIVEMLGIGFLHDFLHDIFHIRDHSFKKFGWFRRLTEKHVVHHDDTTRNFGIFFFLWDRVFGTHDPAKHS